MSPTGIPPRMPSPRIPKSNPISSQPVLRGKDRAPLRAGPHAQSKGLPKKWARLIESGMETSMEEADMLSIFIGDADPADSLAQRKAAFTGILSEDEGQIKLGEQVMAMGWRMIETEKQVGYRENLCKHGEALELCGRAISEFRLSSAERGSLLAQARRLTETEHVPVPEGISDEALRKGLAEGRRLIGEGQAHLDAGTAQLREEIFAYANAIPTHGEEEPALIRDGKENIRKGQALLREGQALLLQCLSAESRMGFYREGAALIQLGEELGAQGKSIENGSVVNYGMDLRQKAKKGLLFATYAPEEVEGFQYTNLSTEAALKAKRDATPIGGMSPDLGNDRRKARIEEMQRSMARDFRHDSSKAGPILFDLSQNLQQRFPEAKLAFPALEDIEIKPSYPDAGRRASASRPQAASTGLAQVEALRPLPPLESGKQGESAPVTVTSERVRSDSPAYFNPGPAGAGRDDKGSGHNYWGGQGFD